jgi:post-segregation antitoxin (ccd killing protein)
MHEQLDPPNEIARERRLAAWAEMSGATVTDSIKRLVADDLAGSPQERAATWHHENASALSAEARVIESNGVPGSHVDMNYPGQDA